MASICPVCSTENRDGANFCRSCGIKLSAAGDRIPPPPTPEREWATTAPAQLRAPTIPAPLEEIPPAPMPARQSFFSRSPASAPRHDDEEQTVLMLHDDGSPRVPAPPAAPQGLESNWAPSRERSRKPPRVRIRKPAAVERAPRWRAILLWVGLLVMAVAMIVAGWSGYGTRKTAPTAEEIAPPAAEVPAPVAAPLAAEPPPSAPAEPAAMDAQPADQAAPAAPAEAAPAASPPPKPPAKQARKQPAAAAAPQPAAEAPPPVAVPAPPPAPAAPAEPAAMCGDRNFIARAQCMAAQCLKPEYKAHAQCEAVRRQQRIEEEKRNPTLIN
ncbi:zinc ribbon domain-containing protein [Variovorax sp. CAN2819]|uniref:zinc ribbon domain-containing protein n=1 Tax=Variovorax sp. CAN15 TaxID=3046727 RepID=UPI0026491DBE|nr:zinc ribbon domain-containing protein [Variovorax sp. CAN15]MDN6882807.1 zinc ribbon domain-containing protein [Variovorax sp. CAN15]